METSFLSKIQTTIEDNQKRQLANNQHEISGLGYLATEAAYRYGKDWLEELKQVFEDHINYVVDLFGKETKIKVMKPQGTYLIWLDFQLMI